MSLQINNSEALLDLNNFRKINDFPRIIWAGALQARCNDRSNQAHKFPMIRCSTFKINLA